MAVNINVPSQVKTYANLASFPASGALKTIYIAEDTNKTYRWTGSVYVEVSASASGITIGTTAITSGTVGRVLFEGTGNVVQQSSSLFWDATNNRLGIGTSSPLSDIDISKSVGSNGSVFIRARNTNSGGEAAISVTNDLYYAAFELFGSTFGMGLSNTALFTTQSGITNLGFATLGAANISFRTNSTGSTNERLTIFGSSGNVGINTTTDAGFRLDVNGTARVQGNTTISLNQNAITQINISNTTSGSSASPILNLTSDVASGIFQFGKQSTLTSVYKTIGAKDGFIYNGTTGGDISILNDFATGRIKFATGGASTAQMTLFSTGNFAINTTTDAGFRLDVNGTARVSGQLSSGASGTNGNIGLRRTSDGSIVGSFYTDAAQTIVKEHTGTGGVLLNGFDTTSLKWVGTSSQPRVGIGFNGTINATCHIKGAFATSATSSLLIENSAGTAAMRVRDDLVIILPNLPTSSAGLPTSAIWNDAGTLKIV